MIESVVEGNLGDLLGQVEEGKLWWGWSLGPML